ncbi:MAG: hypothetical protein ACRDGH_05090 [Candidatus Limnocylindria bacterium]
MAASEISSGRVDAHVEWVRAGLARYSAKPQVAVFLDWSAEVLAANANVSEYRI